jgi:high-affinity iron transporter
VAGAVGLCVLVGVALEVYSRDLPQRRQEGLETIIGVLVVAMVTYMVVWMRRHSRELKGQLEVRAADALTGTAGAGRAMVLMAFLAVIREGFETVVFLLAAFHETGSGPAAGLGALLGIGCAVGLGYGIYRGGVRLNLSKFFRATGLVLVLVAAGLVVNALHTAHEAGWLDVGQRATVDLSRLVQPGTVQASLFTGMLGIQTHPVVIEVVGWMVYLVPVGCYVGWPPDRSLPKRAVVRGCAVAAAALGAAAVVLAFVAPTRPAPSATAGAAAVSRTASAAVVATEQGQYRLHSLGAEQHAGWPTDVFLARLPGGTDTHGRPPALALDAVARLNDGRLPIGLAAARDTVPVSYTRSRTLTVWLDTRTDLVIDLSWVERVTTTVRSGDATFPLADVATTHTGAPPGSVTAAIEAARDAHVFLDRRAVLRSLAAACAVLAGIAVMVAGAFLPRAKIG